LLGKRGYTKKPDIDVTFSVRTSQYQTGVFAESELLTERGKKGNGQCVSLQLCLAIKMKKDLLVGEDTKRIFAIRARVIFIEVEGKSTKKGKERCVRAH